MGLLRVGIVADSRQVCNPCSCRPFGIELDAIYSFVRHRREIMRFERCLLLALMASSLIVGVVGAQGANGITSPRDNAVVHGVVLIEGTATDPNFLRYELAFFKEFDPLGEWVVFATGDQPVVNGLLATWDTMVGRDAGAPFYLDGTYRLRLRVVRQDSNYDEYYVLGISLDNEQQVETPTETPEAEPTVSPIPTSALMVPTELPTLTPFPAATPRPTAQTEGDAAVEEEPESVPEAPFLDLEGEISTDQITSGICLGGRMALVFFALLVAYVLLRALMRLLIGRARDWFSRQ